MAVFQSAECTNKYGKLVLASASDVVDRYGAIRGGASFKNAEIPDRYGNLGSGTTAYIGYQNAGLTTNSHLQSWTTSGQTLPLALPITAGSTVVLGAIDGAEIIATGSIVTTGGLIFAGTARTINNASGTTTQTGGGIVTLEDPFTVGINGVTNIRVEAGAVANWGTDWTKKFGYFYGTSGNAQLTNEGEINVRSSSYTDNNPQNGGNSAGAIFRYLGNPDTKSFYGRTSNFPNNGLLEIKDAIVGPFGVTGTGITRVFDGATYRIKSGQGFAGSLKISGSGTGLAGYPQAALAIDYANNMYGVGIELEADATIAYAAQRDAASAYNYTPPINSTADKTLTIGCPSINAGGPFLDYGVTASMRMGAVSPNLLGPVKIAYGDLYFDVANVIPNAASLTVGEFGHITVATAQSFKSLNGVYSTREIFAASTITLTAQDPTPVSTSFAGTGSVVISGGQLLLDRASEALTGTFNASGTSKIGTVQAVTALSGPLTFTGGASTLVVSNVGGSASKITATTWTATSGFKVDVPAGLTAGTYTIGTKTAGTPPAPTVGVNDSGLTATFAWVSNNLVMTLA